eukprot:6179548-Pleurochrysis_carterae.AAC.1
MWEPGETLLIRSYLSDATSRYLSDATYQTLLIRRYLSDATSQTLLIRRYFSDATSQTLLLRRYLSRANYPQKRKARRVGNEQRKDRREGALVRWISTFARKPTGFQGLPARCKPPHQRT